MISKFHCDTEKLCAPCAQKCLIKTKSPLGWNIGEKVCSVNFKLFAQVGDKAAAGQLCRLSV